MLGFLEGMSLILLTGIGMPLKYAFDRPDFVKAIGPVHGILFLLFVIQTISVSIEHRWGFSRITWKVLLSCLVPFGTMYIDYRFLRHLRPEQ